MMAIELYSHQKKAIEELRSGSILCGGVGTGKSRTALAYYYIKECKGDVRINGEGCTGIMKTPRDLYIITTAKKRDSGEWEEECAHFGLFSDEDKNVCGIKVVIDSWNNIKKYQNIYGAFFIFDEQRVVGYGAWSKSFIRIANRNRWILLTATPGDTWSDYIPVFIANGFYKNKSDFLVQHAVFNRYSKYPKIDRYVGVGKLIKHRSEILVKMECSKPAENHHHNVVIGYSRYLYSRIAKDRWDIYDNCPIKETGKLCYLMRKVVNSDCERIAALERLVKEHDRAIIFYNYDYELDILREVSARLNIPKGEWNGQEHTEIPKEERWMYLVQYAAGCEGWNCTTTDTIIFYSQSYSYRMTIQAAGRIDRLNTPYKDLHYYHLKSTAPIDIAISRALSQKKNFNEKSFLGS